MVQKRTRTRQTSSTFMFFRIWTIQVKAVKWYEGYVERQSKDICVVALVVTDLSENKMVSDK